jgi:hypothetical protein
MRLCLKIDGGLGAMPPSKLRPMLKARGASMQATHAIGTAKSLFTIILQSL